MNKWRLFGIALFVAAVAAWMVFMITALDYESSGTESLIARMESTISQSTTEYSNIIPTLAPAIVKAGDPRPFTGHGEVVTTLDISLGPDMGIYIARIIAAESQHPSEYWTGISIPIRPSFFSAKAVDGWYRVEGLGSESVRVEVDSESRKGFALPFGQYFEAEGIGIKIDIELVRGEVWIKLIGSTRRDWPGYLETRLRVQEGGLLTVSVLDGSVYPKEPGRPILEQQLEQMMPANGKFQIQIANINGETVVGVLSDRGGPLGLVPIPHDMFPLGSLDLEVEGTPGSFLYLNRVATIRPQETSLKLLALEYGLGDWAIYPAAFDGDGNLWVSTSQFSEFHNYVDYEERRLMIVADGVVTSGEGDSFTLASIDIDEFNGRLFAWEKAAKPEAESAWYERLTQAEMALIVLNSERLYAAIPGGAAQDVPLNRVDEGGTYSGSSGLVQLSRFIFGVVLDQPSVESLSVVDYEGDEKKIDVYIAPYLLQAREGEYLVKRLVLGPIGGTIGCFDNPGNRVRTGGAGTYYSVPTQNVPYLLRRNSQHGMLMTFWDDDDLERQLITDNPGNEDFLNRLLLNRTYGLRTLEFLDAIGTGKQASTFGELNYLSGVARVLLNVGDSGNWCSG